MYYSGKLFTQVQAEPEALIQKARIEADGGTVIDFDFMNLAIRTYKSLGIYGNAKLLTDANFGVKKDGAGKVSKLYDVSGNNNDAVQTVDSSKPIWSIENGKGIITYDGGSDGFDCGYINGWTSSLTLSVWIKCTSTTSGWIITKDDVGSNRSFAIGVTEKNIEVFFMTGGYYDYSIIGSIPINGNTLYNIVAIYLNGDTFLYVNGIESVLTFMSNSALGNINTNSKLVEIGMRKGLQCFNGKINETKIINIALTQSQITTLYNLGL